MRKSITLTAVFFILSSCAVQKKQPYIFDWYVPHSGNSTGSHIPKNDNIEVLNPSIDQNLINSEHDQANNDGTASDIKILKRKSHVKKSYSFKVQQDPRVNEEAVQLIKQQPEERAIRRKSADRFLFMTASLIGFAVMGLIWAAKKTTTQITRWAKANPKKTQGLITGLQVPLLGLGVMNGHSLNQMGYDISDPFLYGWGAATAVGFLSVPFMPKHDTIAIPQQVNRKRLAFLGITLSSLMLMTGFGNRIEQNYAGTRLAKTVETIDQSVFYTSNVQVSDPAKDVKLVSSNQKIERQTKAGISGAGAVFLIFLLVTAACAGICLATGAFGAVSVVGVIGGILLLFLSILGIIGVGKARRLQKMQKTQAR